jgi:purine-binding chemotaxis protein CheW
MSGLEQSECFVLFEVSGNIWAVRSRLLQSVEMPGPVTPVPNTLPFVEGITFARGQVIPRINLRLRFGLPGIPLDVQARTMVVRSGNRTAGMLVDSARETVFIPLDTIRPREEAGHDGPPDSSLRYREGTAILGSRTVSILNLEEVIEGS